MTLADLAEANLAFAQQAVQRAGVTLSDFLAVDARNLSMLGPDSFDGVLLLGPLYHLLDGSDRLAALAEFPTRAETRGSDRGSISLPICTAPFRGAASS